MLQRQERPHVVAAPETPVERVVTTRTWVVTTSKTGGHQLENGWSWPRKRETRARNGWSRLEKGRPLLATGWSRLERGWSRIRKGDRASRTALIRKMLGIRLRRPEGVCDPGRTHWAEDGQNPPISTRLLLSAIMLSGHTSIFCFSHWETVVTVRLSGSCGSS